MKDLSFKNLNQFLILSLLFITLFSCKKNEVVVPEENPEELPTIHWKATDEIIIESDLFIDSVKFIIDPGVNVRIKSGCNIFIGDKYSVELTAKGTAQNPINFIPYNPDGNPNNSFWGSIIIRKLYVDPVSPAFEYCNFIKGGGEGSQAVLEIKTTYISIKNCLIDYSMNFGIYAEQNGGFKEFYGNTIKHTNNHPISISATYTHTIGKENNIYTDLLNHGILINTQNINSGFDTIIWQGQTVPYIIPHTISVSSNSSKTLFFFINEGATLKLAKNKGFTIGQHIFFQAYGTQENPITFTSLELNPQPGDWINIGFGSNNHVIMENCIFEYGGKYLENMVDNGMVRLNNANDVSIKDCLFRYSESTAISLNSSASNLPSSMFTHFSNNSFTNLNGFALSIYPHTIPKIDKNNNFNAYGIHVKGSDIEQTNIFWKDLGSDYYIDSYIRINGESGASVEIEPGVTMKFDGGGLRVGTASSWEGKLIAKGTEEKPIIFTSAKENPAWGDWGGILFYSGSIPGCILDHCEILYAGEYTVNERQASLHICGNDSAVTITNTTIAHSSHWGMCITGSAEPTTDNNTFFDNLEGDVLITNK